MGMQDELREIRKLWGGFWSSRVLLTANNFRIFDYLKTPKTAGELAKVLKTDGRATEILLDAVTGLGLLKKTGGKYKNTKTTGLFLAKDGPYYQGDIIKHADILWKNWSSLDEVVKSGKPARKAHDQGSFIRGMHNNALLKTAGVIDAIGMKGVKSAVDVGGGPGTYSIEMAKRGVSVTLFDLPETIKIAKDIIKGSGVKDIAFQSGDFMKDEIRGTFDLIFISQVLHAYSAKDNIHMLKKAKTALNPNGRVVIQEFVIDNNRTSPPHGALFAVNMLVNTTGGGCYAPVEMKKWLSGLGYKGIKAQKLGDSVLVSGRR